MFITHPSNRMLNCMLDGKMSENRSLTSEIFIRAVDTIVSNLGVNCYNEANLTKWDRRACREGKIFLF